MGVTLFTDRRMLNHRTPARHPERPERLQAVLRHLERTGYLATCPSGPVREATVEELGRVHAAEYLQRVVDLEAAGGGMLDADTWVFPGSNSAARLAAGACVEAVSYVLGGKDQRALCLVRPPGHHAAPAEGMGFCIYANVALAAAEAFAHFDVNRILIADFDVHHGNGTQDVFYDSNAWGFSQFIDIRSIRGPERGKKPAPVRAWGLRPTSPYPMARRGPRTTRRFVPASKNSLTVSNRSSS
jgi:acetoin utilization deacetylase AcuC-like enzyme